MQTILGSNGQIGEGLAKELHYSIVKMWAFTLGGLFNKRIRELQELLPRYNCLAINMTTSLFPTNSRNIFQPFKSQVMREALPKF